MVEKGHVWTSETAADWHLKVKDIDFDVALTNNYRITINMQKISSLYKLTLKIPGHILGSSTGTKNFTSLYVGVPMADKIGLKDGRPSVTILWTLAEPNIIPGLQPEGGKSLYCSMETSILSLRFFRTWYSISHMDKVI